MEIVELSTDIQNNTIALIDGDCVRIIDINKSKRNIFLGEEEAGNLFNVLYDIFYKKRIVNSTTKELAKIMVDNIRVPLSQMRLHDDDKLFILDQVKEIFINIYENKEA